MSGIAPSGTDAHGVLPEANQAASHAARPQPTPGNDGVDWIVLLEIDAYQKTAT